MNYIYVCKDCKREFNVEHSIKDDPKVICQSCGATAVRRFGMPLVRLDGAPLFYPQKRGEKSEVNDELTDMIDEGGPTISWDDLKEKESKAGRLPGYNKQGKRVKCGH